MHAWSTTKDLSLFCFCFSGPFGFVFFSFPDPLSLSLSHTHTHTHTHTCRERERERESFAQATFKRLSACACVCIRVICNTCFVSFPRQQLLVQRVSRPGWSGVSERSAAKVPGGPQEPRPHHGESWVRVKLQALVYDILPSTTAVFSYAIGSRKLSANERFFLLVLKQ